MKGAAADLGPALFRSAGRLGCSEKGGGEKGGGARTAGHGLRLGGQGSDGDAAGIGFRDQAAQGGGMVGRGMVGHLAAVARQPAPEPLRKPRPSGRPALPDHGIKVRVRVVGTEAEIGQCFGQRGDTTGLISRGWAIHRGRMPDQRRQANRYRARKM